MNRITKIILVLLIVVLTISSYFFIKELEKNKKETELFDDLQEIVENTEKTTYENPFSDNLEINEGNMSSQNTYNLENITAKTKTKGLLTYLKQISGIIWNKQSVQRSKTVLRPFIFIKEFDALFNRRVRASKGHLIKDLKRGNELSKLYKALGLNMRN